MPDIETTPTTTDTTDAAYCDPTEDPCEVCADGEQECGCCGEDPDCLSCDGSAYAVPDHCCDCGGSPYCVRCHTCGAYCVGSCKCPITVQFQDGSTRTL